MRQKNAPSAMISMKSRYSSQKEKDMTSVSQVEQSLKSILEERATVLARETGCIQRQRKFSGADLLQTLVFGWLTHPEMSLEMLASTAATRQVQVTDTAVHKRFSKPCAQFLHAVLEEVTSVIVEADREVPVELLRRFEAVVLEDSSSIALPEELAEQWQGCGGAPGEGQAAVKLHVRWELKQGQLQGPKLTDGRVSDRSSPFKEAPLPAGSLYIADVGYLDWGSIAGRLAAGSYSLTRAQARTRYWTPEGKSLKVDPLLPQQVGQTKERMAYVWAMSIDTSCACSWCEFQRKWPGSGAQIWQQMPVRFSAYYGNALKHIVPIHLAFFLDLYCRDKVESEAIMWQ
jgi:hypothetical protein